MKKLRNRVMALLMGILLLGNTVQAEAAQVQNGTAYPISTNDISSWPQGPDLYAETAVLMDADTGTVLYNKGMDEFRYPASITKIMTALIALENSSMEDQVTFTEACLADQAAGSGNIGMQVGEVLTMKQCLLALMVQSANDVATQIAVQVAGSVPAFADMMNQKAQQLGCINTHFVNASGMPDENHYTTAYDMALIFKEAIKNQQFREIIGTQSFTIDPTNMNGESRTYSTHHALTAAGAPEYYEGCFGGKTGVTDSSLNTLVSGAERNGMTLIAVAMRAGAGEVCQDHISLFNYGFDNFSKIEVPGGSVILPNNEEISSLETAVVPSTDGTPDKLYYYRSDYYVGEGVEEVTPEPTQEVIQVTEEATPTPAIDDTSEAEAEAAKAEEKLAETYKYIIYGLGGLVIIAVIIALVSAIVRRKKK
ncbi:MAG: D-alanyl-D-alanine carboxypeptidase [Clostridia bacterium]|nr:D-alanyl-D-alanine carboxypeptidase [Clostridia bacterium]NCC44392.1 D-alanyl-D-alanine carboxypeptidase [Clostridia bacterium]